MKRFDFFRSSEPAAGECYRLGHIPSRLILDSFEHVGHQFLTLDQAEQVGRHLCSIREAQVVFVAHGNGKPVTVIYRKDGGVAIARKGKRK